jgi:hypothetical protein
VFILAVDGDGYWLHVLAPLSPGKEPQSIFNRRLGEPTENLNNMEKKLLPLIGTKTSSLSYSVCNLVYPSSEYTNYFNNNVLHSHAIPRTKVCHHQLLPYSVNIKKLLDSIFSILLAFIGWWEIDV